MKDLSQFVKDNQKFLKLGDGDSFIGKFINYSIGINRFDPEKETVNYKLQYKDDDKCVFWNSGRMDVAQAFSKIKPGTMIKIIRLGAEKNNTSYTIVPLNNPVSSFNPDQDAIEPE